MLSLATPIRPWPPRLEPGTVLIRVMGEDVTGDIGSVDIHLQNLVNYMVSIGSIVTRTSHGHFFPLYCPDLILNPPLFRHHGHFPTHTPFINIFAIFLYFLHPLQHFWVHFLLPDPFPAFIITCFLPDWDPAHGGHMGQPSLEELNRNQALCRIVTGQTGKSSLLLTNFSSSIREVGQPFTQPIREAGQLFTQLFC